jgi:hypothetical protein
MIRFFRVHRHCLLGSERQKAAFAAFCRTPCSLDYWKMIEQVVAALSALVLTVKTAPGVWLSGDN